MLLEGHWLNPFEGIGLATANVRANRVSNTPSLLLFFSLLEMITGRLVQNAGRIIHAIKINEHGNKSP